MAPRRLGARGGSPPPSRAKAGSAFSWRPPSSLPTCPFSRPGFVWDDDAHVTRPDLRSLHGLWRIWFEPGATQQYYPFLHTAFWAEYRIWGNMPRLASTS